MRFPDKGRRRKHRIRQVSQTDEILRRGLRRGMQKIRRRRQIEVFLREEVLTLRLRCTLRISFRSRRRTEWKLPS